MAYVGRFVAWMVCGVLAVWAVGAVWHAVELRSGAAAPTARVAVPTLSWCNSCSQGQPELAQKRARSAEASGYAAWLRQYGPGVAPLGTAAAWGALLSIQPITGDPTTIPLLAVGLRTSGPIGGQTASQFNSLWSAAGELALSVQSAVPSGSSLVDPYLQWNASVMVQITGADGASFQTSSVPLLNGQTLLEVDASRDATSGYIEVWHFTEQSVLASESATEAQTTIDVTALAFQQIGTVLADYLSPGTQQPSPRSLFAAPPPRSA